MIIAHLNAAAAEYSGMLPGLVAGFYTFDECHVDLAQLCTFASARMIHAEAVGMDKQVQFLFASTAQQMRPYFVICNCALTLEAVAGMMYTNRLACMSGGVKLAAAAAAAVAPIRQ